jgi:hypothetical protein
MDTAGNPSLPRLPRPTYWAILAVGITLFLFVEGPVWQHAWSFDQVNRAIFYSYLPLPALVVAALAWKRRLTLRAFFLDTVEITLLKYSITFGFALVLWTVHDPPPVPPGRMAAAAQPAEITPAPTPIDPSRTGVIRGVVEDEGGKPLTGAVVFVSSGLEGLVFAPRAGRVELANVGGGIEPKVAAVQARAPLFARSADGHLHTLVGRDDQGAVFHVPLLPAGQERPVEIREPRWMKLSCSIHPAERSAELAVFNHPFFTVTGADGAFRFEGVPEGHVKLEATFEGRSVGAAVDLRPGAESAARLAWSRRDAARTCDRAGSSGPCSAPDSSL